MNRAVAFVVAGGLMVSACTDYRGMPVNAYQRWQDRLAIIFGFANANITWPPCYVWTKNAYGGYWGGLPIDKCFRLEPPRRWDALWRLSRHEAFCVQVPGTAKRDCRSWLRITTPELSRLTGKPITNHMLGSGLYAIDFIGRRTVVAGPAGHIYTVDRIIGLKKIDTVSKAEELRSSGRLETEGLQH